MLNHLDESPVAEHRLGVEEGPLVVEVAFSDKLLLEEVDIDLPEDSQATCVGLHLFERIFPFQAATLGAG